MPIAVLKICKFLSLSTTIMPNKIFVVGRFTCPGIKNPVRDAAKIIIAKSYTAHRSCRIA